MAPRKSSKSKSPNPASTTSQMLISYVPGEECRVAVVENGLLEEFHAESARNISRVGNIYVGTVTNVEPAIQAAFVDFGVEDHGFLHVSDVHPRYFPGEDEDDTTESIGRKTPRRDRPPIQRCFKRGDQVEVQVLKEGVGTKGPTLTSYLSIPGRFLVMMPQMDKVGVSRKVEDEDQRREMRAILDQLELPEGFGFILRTAGMDRTKLELKRDLAYLQRLWKDMEARKGSGNKPRLLYSESDLLVRALRDILSPEIDEVIIDHELALTRAARFLKIVAPRSKVKLLQYAGQTPLFHSFGVEQQIAQIHAREVPLPSGGRLVIDETEALVAIDVNSGKSRESRDAETNAYHTNIEAVDAICRQLKLRDLGGIVINDLIDMRSSAHRKDIEQRFRDRLKRDRAKTTTLQISEFGILEMTRQRMRGSHESVHFTGCPTCHGRGLVQKPDSVASDSLRNLAALLDQQRVAKVEMVVSPRVASELLSARRKMLNKLERDSGKHVDVRVSETVPPDRITFYAYDAQGADVEIEKLPAPRVPKDLKEWEFSPKRDEEETWATDVRDEQRPEPEPELSESEAAELAEPHPIELDDELEDVDEGRESGRDQARGGRGDQRGGNASGERGGDRGPAREGESGEGGGRRRRRRRRRGGRGRGGEGQPMDGQSSDQGARNDGSDRGPRDDARAQGRAPELPGMDDDDQGPGDGPGNGSGEMVGDELDRGARAGDESAGDRGFQAEPRPDGQPGEPGEGGRRRRRRRRRRGRGGQGGPGQGQDFAQSGGQNGGQAGGQAGAAGGSPEFNQDQFEGDERPMDSDEPLGDDRDADDREPIETRGPAAPAARGDSRSDERRDGPRHDRAGRRGDSWDLTPEELMRLRPPGTPTPLPEEPFVEPRRESTREPVARQDLRRESRSPQHDLMDDVPPLAAPRSGPPITRDADAPALERVEPAARDDDAGTDVEADGDHDGGAPAGTAESGGEGGAEGEGPRRRRRRRRGGRGRGGNGGGEPGTPGAAPAADSGRSGAGGRDAGPAAGARPEPRPEPSREGRSGYQKRVPDYKQDSASSPSRTPAAEPKPRSAEPVPEARSQPKPESKPESKAESKPESKPKFLYALGRRKLAPSEVKNRPRD